MKIGKLTNQNGDEIDLDFASVAVALSTMGGHIPAERMAEFATALIVAQHSRRVTQAEIRALYNEWAAGRLSHGEYTAEDAKEKKKPEPKDIRDRRAKIIKLYESGATIQEMSLQSTCSESTVKRDLKRLREEGKIV